MLKHMFYYEIKSITFKYYFYNIDRCQIKGNHKSDKGRGGLNVKSDYRLL